MLMGSFGQGVWCSANVAQTVLAVGQQWVANLTRLWPQDEHQAMYAISLLKHVVQMCTELLVQLLSVSLRRNLTGKLNDNVKWGTKSTKHGNIGRNVCLFT
jgi:hypothetical protein